jgi:uracil-DNA glycosylase
MTQPDTIKLDPAWKSLLASEFAKPSMASLKSFLIEEKTRGKTIFPPLGSIFHAFDLTRPQEIKAVILGQDPYHGPGQAMGLSFSVPPGVPPPPSLQNIYKALALDLPSFVPPKHGCLDAWGKEGVFLLNTVLTVEAHKAASHQGRGWEPFTDGVISALSQNTRGIVFMLWGSHAQRKAPLIDASKHLILTSVHPSPLSAHRGFLTCGHFSKTNEYLKTQGKTPIQWNL